MAKNKTEIKICSREYTIISDEDSEYVHRVAYYLDSKIAEINKAYIGLTTVMSTTLAALNITEDYLKTKDTLTDMDEEISKLRELVRDLEIASRVRNDGNDETKKKLADLQRENRVMKQKLNELELENNALKTRDKRVTSIDNNRQVK